MPSGCQVHETSVPSYRKIMSLELTHTEACELVEELLDRMVKTLAYVRMKIDEPHSVHHIADDGKPHQLSLFAEVAIEEANLLKNVNFYGAYLAGAKRMLTALKDHGMLYIDGIKHGKENKFINKALLDLYMASSRNLEWFLTDLPDDSVRVRIEFMRDRKGRIKEAKATFVKKETAYKEI